MYSICDCTWIYRSNLFYLKYVSAIFKAVSDGKKGFEMMVVFSESKNLTPPCGTCRQVLSEFCNENFRVILANSTSKKEFTLVELLPYSFNPKFLNSKWSPLFF